MLYRALFLGSDCSFIFVKSHWPVFINVFLGTLKRNILLDHIVFGAWEIISLLWFIPFIIRPCSWFPIKCSYLNVCLLIVITWLHIYQPSFLMCLFQPLIFYLWVAKVYMYLTELYRVMCVVYKSISSGRLFYPGFVGRKLPSK